MGFPHIPKVARIVIAAVVALLLIAGGVWALSNNSAPPCALNIPSDRDMDESPDSLLTKQQLGQAFGVTFRKWQENTIRAQGAQDNFTETNNKFLVKVLQVRGQQAAETWQRLLATFDYPDAPQIGPQVKLQPDLIVAVYKDETLVWVELAGCHPPKDGRALSELGTLLFEKIKA